MPYTIEQGEWIQRFDQAEAFWKHDGNPNRPHALLTSNGMHSNAYFNVSQITRDVHLFTAACMCLLDPNIRTLPKRSKIKWVFGSAKGSISLAYECSRRFSAAGFGSVFNGFTEPTNTKGGEKIMTLQRFEISRGTICLFVEDVINSGATTRSSIYALEQCGAEVLPYLYILGNRSGRQELDGRRIVSLIEIPDAIKDMQVWHPDDCPLCEMGSRAIRPKQNWTKLKAQYAP